MNIVKTLFDSTLDLFSDSSSTTTSLFDNINSVSLYTVPEVDSKIMSILNIKKYGAYVAGGAALRWYQTLPVNSHDIDIWFSNPASMDQMCRDVMSKYTLKFNSDNANTYEISVDGKLYRVQLIKTQSECTVEEIISKFDITVCQIATDGIRWYASSDFAQDVKNRRLRFIKHTPKTTRRLVKYWTYGFEPDAETLEAIMRDPQIMWNYESNNDDDYENAI